MADKDNESAPGVVCCNLDSTDVQRLFAYAKAKDMVVQEAGTFLLKQTLHQWWEVFGVYP